ncbi:MAG: hypothetical protein R3C03_00925 [Pirellulaceae bacterium]
MSPLTGETNSNMTRSTILSFPKSRWWIRACIVLVAAIQAAGCCYVPGTNNGPRLVDQAFVCYRDRVWARRAYNMQYGDSCRPFRDHFRRGYIEGYCAVCNGGEGYVPALPPEDYWTYEYQSSEGADCVNAYFEGYPLGASAAKQRGIDKYHDVYISRMIDAAIEQEKTGVTLPSDIPIIASGDADLTPEELDNYSNTYEFGQADESTQGFEKFKNLFQDQ